jgi:D-alanyl-D-alanine carboxypeptidase
LSITVEGWGEVLAVDAEQPLLPASNQKLLTAMGALEVLPGDGHFETLVVADDAGNAVWRVSNASNPASVASR